MPATKSIHPASFRQGPDWPIDRKKYLSSPVIRQTLHPQSILDFNNNKVMINRATLDHKVFPGRIQISAMCKSNPRILHK